jgi:hypothetical protein
VVLIEAQWGRNYRVCFHSVYRPVSCDTRRFSPTVGEPPYNTGNDKRGVGPGRGTVAHALTTTHWLAPKWGGQSPLLSLSNNTNTNQPTNRGRQKRRGITRGVCRSRWSIPESRNRVVCFCSPFDTGKPPFVTPPSSWVSGDGRQMFRRIEL